MCVVAAVSAQTVDDAEEFDSLDSIRLNPEIEYDIINEGVDINIPAFINRKSNVINLNGADWSHLKSAVKATNPNLSVVHIGDSHIQAEIGTSVTREMLQLRIGNGGRGLVSPLRLSGTNQPNDYGFGSSSRWTAQKFMKQPWTSAMGFNGSAITLSGKTGDITLSTAESDEDYNPFTEITLYHSGRLTVNSVTGENGEPIPFSISLNDESETKIDLWVSTVKATINFSASPGLTLFCASLLDSRPGAVYHAIGNNGATYASYNNIDDFGVGISRLSPDLIILSMGTNEAFGRRDIAGFKNNVRRMIRTLTKDNPDARILIVTPMECDRRVRRRNGRRRSIVYTVNDNIRPIRDALIDVAREMNVAVYDWYSVAGGDGAAAKWMSAGLYGKDHVHHTAGGYRLQGYLFYDALSKTLYGNE